MRLQYLAENLRQATENDDIFVHTLNNDIPRSEDFVGLARAFCDELLEFRARRRNSKIFVSLLLPRFDGYGNGQDIINSEIIRLIGHFSNIFLINHDNINDQSHFTHDNLHLTRNSFEIMAQNWLYKLGT